MKNDFNLKPSRGFRGDSCHICGRVDDRKRKPDRRISIYNFFLFLTRLLSRRSYLPIAYQTISENSFFDRNNISKIHTIARRKTIYPHVRKYLRAKTNINYSRLDFRGGQHNLGLSERILFSSQLSHWFRLIPAGRITMGDTACVGALKGHMCPRRKKNDITLSHTKSRTWE